MFDVPGLDWALAAAMLDACNVATIHPVAQPAKPVNRSINIHVLSSGLIRGSTDNYWEINMHSGPTAQGARQ